MLPSGLANPLLCRFAPPGGLVTSRQTFVRRCQWWQIAPAGRFNNDVQSQRRERPLSPAIESLQSAGVPVMPLLRRVGSTPEVIADR